MRILQGKWGFFFALIVGFIIWNGYLFGEVYYIAATTEPGNFVCSSIDVTAPCAPEQQTASGYIKWVLHERNPSNTIFGPAGWLVDVGVSFAVGLILLAILKILFALPAVFRGTIRLSDPL